MYLGMAGVLIAHALGRRSPRALIPTVAFVAWIDAVQIPGEEAFLRTHFGTQYEQYEQSTRRWL